MSKAVIGACVMLIAAVTLPAFGQGVSEATGQVVDREGNPIQNAVVTFHSKSKPDVHYTAKTNKKGKYFVPGLFTAKEDELWLMEIKAEGLLPVEVRIVSRTVNKVLIDDLTAKLGPGKKPPEIIIRPLGKATVDWTLAPADEFAAEVPVVAETMESLLMQYNQGQILLVPYFLDLT